LKNWSSKQTETTLPELKIKPHLRTEKKREVTETAEKIQKMMDTARGTADREIGP